MQLFFRASPFPTWCAQACGSAHLGTSSVRYEIGLFRNDEDLASAQGHFVHVYVERATGKPVPLPEKLQAALKPLAV